VIKIGASPVTVTDELEAGRAPDPDGLTALVVQMKRIADALERWNPPPAPLDEDWLKPGAMG
jgi:hypothetical protein